MIFFKKHLLLIIVDVSASTGAFAGTVCLITVPTKAPVKAETSTIINKRLFFKELHFELLTLYSEKCVLMPCMLQAATDFSNY